MLISVNGFNLLVKEKIFGLEFIGRFSFGFGTGGRSELGLEGTVGDKSWVKILGEFI